MGTGKYIGGRVGTRTREDVAPVNTGSGMRTRGSMGEARALLRATGPHAVHATTETTHGNDSGADTSHAPAMQSIQSRAQLFAVFRGYMSAVYLPWSWEAAGNTIGARWTGESTARPRFMCNSLRMQFDVHLPAPELALCSCAANPLRSQKQLSAPSWGRGRHSAAQRDLV